MLYVIFGIIMVVFAWMQMAFGLLQKHKNDARTQWIRIDALLQTRSAYILELLELVDNDDYEERELLADIFELNGGYSQSDDREVVSAQAEAVTPLLDKLIEVTKKYGVLQDNKEIQELIHELYEIEENIIFESVKYNQSVGLYNQHRDKPSVKLQVAILGAPQLKGFHIRQTDID